jgi:segregation and condensation protein A
MNVVPLNPESTPPGNKGVPAVNAGVPAVNERVAKLYGEPVIELPHDLYIPPDALEVVLEAFEGPLDLLLYLIRKENLDILDIPMAPLTRQYLEYVEIMRSKNLELAAEYLVMAAMLMEIKSRLLRPSPPKTIRAPSWCGACSSTSR